MIFNVIVALYGISSILASLVHGRKKSIQVSSAGMMLLGGILLVISVFLKNNIGLGLLGIGALLVHLSAILNGKMIYGQIDKKHHAIRFLITIVLVYMKVMTI